jgi:G:T-mismatch repair DNA endonuclease (very short patch repair protein)
VKGLPGSQDIANKRRRWAIFVHGCFWHHHARRKLATVPKTNRAFWIEKLNANRRRDERKARTLRRKGFHVLTVWQCQTTPVPLVPVPSRTLASGVLVPGEAEQFEASSETDRPLNAMKVRILKAWFLPV